MGPSHLRKGHSGAGAAALLPAATLLLLLLLAPGAPGPLVDRLGGPEDFMLLLCLLLAKPLKGEGPEPGPLTPLLLLKPLKDPALAPLLLLRLPRLLPGAPNPLIELDAAFEALGGGGPWL